MRKFLMAGVMLLVATMAIAQTKTTYRYEDTQARALDAVAKCYVKPLTVEVKVDATKGRQHFSFDMDKQFVEGDMKGDIANIRSYGVFKATVQANCDIIVAPTFHLYTNDRGGYTLEIIGFAGSFVNWATMTNADLQWIDATQEHNGASITPVVKSTTTR